MEASTQLLSMAKIKQEYQHSLSQAGYHTMPSCMYQQQFPVGSMTSNPAIARSKLFRLHVAKENSQLSHCRRRLDFNQSTEQNLFYGLKPGQPISVARRNERERNRVKLINMTFATLREHLPYEAETTKSKKMSKVDTLKAAIDYIRYLQTLVDDNDTVDAVLSDNCSAMDSCVQFKLGQASSTPQKSPTTTSVTSESSFDGLSTEDEDLLDFANWF